MAEGSWLRDKAAFVGFGHTRYGKRGELGDNGPVPMVIEAVLKACEDAGIDPADLDGFCSYSGDGVEAATLAGSLGIKQLRFTGMGWGGGGGAMGGSFLYAAMAVATGQANYVAITRGVVQGGAYGRRFGGMGATSMPKYPLLVSPGQSFALAARRHMSVYGTTIDHFGEVAINARLNAANNPDARFRDPITMEDHHNSRMICDPLRLLDFCMESDSGNCVDHGVGGKGQGPASTSGPRSGHRDGLSVPVGDGDVRGQQHVAGGFRCPPGSAPSRRISTPTPATVPRTLTWRTSTTTSPRWS